MDQVTLQRQLEQAKQTGELYLSDEDLTNVPLALAKLDNLTLISLSNNQLTSVPPELAQLRKLTALDLSNNQLTSLPPELAQLKNLTLLYLSNNQFTNIPLELTHLVNLRELDCHSNQLTSVPPELAHLENLNKLDLRDNQLTSVPPELAHLENLKELYLSANQLTHIPQELAQLRNLTLLSLSANQLTGVPPALAHLENLEVLSLRTNQLTSLPPELAHLANLRELYLRSNKLINVPPELAHLEHLTLLSLSYNQLTSLPPEFAQLKNLKELHLSGNQLTSLPPEFAQLKNLTWLYLRSNQLANLPPEFAQLKNLTELDLRDNQLSNISPEILAQGTAAILGHLQEQLQEVRPQWISKMLVIGEGGVGKSSLIRTLRNQPFDAAESTTHGINIQTIELQHPNKSEVLMQLNTWDFGGQEIYHATHQFFLSNRSLFILVWNARLGFAQGKLTYWLKTIRANAPDSPILVVATHIDERDADLPFSEFKQQFPQIVGQCAISNKDDIGISDLRQAITNAAAALPLMGEIWPATWLHAATIIRNLPQAQKCISPNQLWQLMREQQVKQEHHVILAKWLHELGDILFFLDREALNDLVILKPQWVTEYISKVLEADGVIDRQGIFTRQCMDQIWSDLELSLRIHFLRLMERFDLSYRTLEDKDISLVVERLAFEPSDYQELWEKPTKKAPCNQLSMKFQLSEILPGIPTWFIARQHRFTTGNHWRTGVLLADGPEHKHLGLVKIGRDPATNVEFLELTVRGPMPHNFFDLLKEGIEVTLKRYPGLKVTRFVPCPDPNQETCRHEFDYANLIKRLERKQPKNNIECPNCLENIYVPQLLFGLHPTTEAAVFQKIDELNQTTQSGFSDMHSGFTELRELLQREFLRQFRHDQQFPESQCPNVFALRPDDRSMWTKDIDQTRINLQLYCQAPGQWHPTSTPEQPENGLYTIDVPKQWLQAMAPHIRRLVRVFKYASPLVSPILGKTLPDIAEAVKADVGLMNALVTKLPDIMDSPEFRWQDDRHEDEIERLSGSALRSLRHFLDEKDPQQHWGGLKRILTPEGDYLWLCEKHAREYASTYSEDYPEQRKQ